jgi:hypothetical protein
MKADLTLNAIISAVVSSQNSCLSMATNQLLIKVGRIKGNVYIRDVTIDQTSEAFLRCKQTVTIDMDSMTGDLRQALKNQFLTYDWKSHQRDTVLKVIDNLTKAFNITNMNGCLAAPINEQYIKVDTVGRDFKMIDYDLTQFATANVKKCIQEGVIRVGEGQAGLLPNYLKSFHDGELFPPEPEVAPAPSCPEYNEQECKIELIITVAVGFCIIVLFLALAVYKGWNIKSKKI